MDSDSDSDIESRASSVDDDEGLPFDESLPRVRQNDPDTTELRGYGLDDSVQNMTDEEWQELGRTISNNSHLKALRLPHGALNDHKMSFLFRELTRSSAITEMFLNDNGLSIAGVRSMLPFLQNANKLLRLDLDYNDIQSEGFNLLFRALRDSPIKELNCENCGIESIEIERNNFPKHLKILDLHGNNINLDGCREVAKLLQGGNATLTDLWLRNNKIDDEGVAILVEALQKNSSLENLELRGNDGISIQGQIMLLKLVNEIASIKATLQSNHTLGYLRVKDINSVGLPDAGDKVQMHIDIAVAINKIHENNPEAAGREKVIVSHLESQNRAALYRLQEVDHSVYSEIDPLHLPEVLSLIDRRHGLEELYHALSSTIMTLFSTMNREKCIQQQREYHAAKVAEHRAKIEELDAELATIKEAAGRNQEDMDSRSNKRRRT